MPLGSRKLKPTLPIAVRKIRNISTATSADSKSTTKLGLEAKITEKGPEAGPSVGAEEEKSSTTTDSTSDEFSVQDWQVSAADFEDAPSWRFEEKQGQGILAGGFDDQLLGKLSILGSPCKVSARFKAVPRDLSVRSGSGIFPTDMNGSHRAVRTLIVWFWLGKRVNPHLNFRAYEVK
jgi:hypothetical protein